MLDTVSRLRMFAGPNGSGKSTLKTVLRSELWGLYVNPDEIEKEIKRFDFLDFSAYGLKVEEKEILNFFQNSTLLEKVDLLDETLDLRLTDNKLSFWAVSVNSYFASVAADFIRQKLVLAGRSFTFETVMSSPDKIAFLKQAQRRGYRTYLYYIATEDPYINLNRVQNRIKMGGHSVPEDKIISRYHRSIAFLDEALRYTNRAYIFDNSGAQQLWLAEVTEGQEVELKAQELPHWFIKALAPSFDLKIGG